MVWVKKNSQDSIVEALRNGDFYSSAGPNPSCMIHAGFWKLHVRLQHISIASLQTVREKQICRRKTVNRSEV